MLSEGGTVTGAATAGGTVTGPISAEHARFIEGSSLLLVMSSAPDAAPDVSPRGDAPGFVRVVGPDRLQLPDRIGNNRVDTIGNVLRDPRIALVFLRVGDERTLQVGGAATILTDPALLATFAVRNRPPRSVMEVSVASATFGPSPAIAAADLWLAEPAGAVATFASLGEVMADQVGGMTKDEAEAWIANSYANKLY